MNEFRTVLAAQSANFQISHHDQVLSLGSCFAQNIALRLSALKFPTLLNPFGILYNPISIAQALAHLLSQNTFSEVALFEHQGLWHSFQHHSDFSAPAKTEALQRINQHLTQGQQFLSNSNRLLLTLGTAHVFVHKATNQIVANCHKLPNTDFDRQRLSISDITQALLPLFQQLKAQQPALEIILTVSPVRHLRDGLLENQKSKATLLLAIESICQALPYTHYFPAYELLLDDLRDYRFYADDLLHPSTKAIAYIWHHFQATYFSPTTQQLCHQIEKLVKASQHRPLHPTSLPHQAFLHQQLQKLAHLTTQYPTLSFEKERKLFEEQLL
ncbi:MAG: GSCFA domain-containing protein [Bacteroidota bacterium]